MNENQKKRIQQIIDKAISKKYVKGAVFSIASKANKETHSFCSDNLKSDSKYYIASINKLVLSALTLQLIHQNKLSITDPLSKFYSKDELAGLHRYKGKEYTNNITISHLLSQTSGLPCYLSDKVKDNVSAIKELEAGIDQAWPLERVLTQVKQMQAHFLSNDHQKAKYIDTNHQLLNRIIETVLEKPIVDILDNLFCDLDMTNTYVCKDTNDQSYVFPYYKNEQRDISQFITSTNNDIISTATDQIKFIQAFFNGYFYPKDKLHTLEKFNNIFFPFKYGIGIQMFYTPRILSPFKATPNMLGHCGSTGSVAFYIPKKDLFIAGTTNQQANPNAAFQSIINIINVLDKS